MIYIIGVSRFSITSVHVHIGVGVGTLVYKIIRLLWISSITQYLHLFEHGSNYSLHFPDIFKNDLLNIYQNRSNNFSGYLTFLNFHLWKQFLVINLVQLKNKKNCTQNIFQIKSVFFFLFISKTNHFKYLTFSYIIQCLNILNIFLF